MEITSTSFVRAIEELAAPRGIGSLEELVERVEAAGGDVTVEELRDWPRPGYGDELDRVLHANKDERDRITRGFVDTFLPVPKKGAQA